MLKSIAITVSLLLLTTTANAGGFYTQLSLDPSPKISCGSGALSDACQVPDGTELSRTPAETSAIENDLGSLNMETQTQLSDANDAEARMNKMLDGMDLCRTC